MTRPQLWRPVIGTVLLGMALTGCGDSEHRSTLAARSAQAPVGLTAFSDCTDLVDGFQRATQAAQQRYGEFPEDLLAMPGDGSQDTKAGAAAPGRQAEGGTVSGEHSSTNTHEADVNEPDLIKTDGKRIVTVTRGVLRVVDAVHGRLTASYDLTGASGLAPGTLAGIPSRGASANLLLSGNRVLVLTNTYRPAVASPMEKSDLVAPSASPGPLLILMDLSGAPKVIASYAIDGELLDARQTGKTVRVVVRSRPTLGVRDLAAGEPDWSLGASRPEDWLPGYTSTTATGRRDTGRPACSAVYQPSVPYSGTSLLTVLTFDLSAASLKDGRPVGIAADGNLVYATPTSLYVANDNRWRTGQGQTTQLYQFTTKGAGRPTFVASGTVPGHLLNQYAMSEWDGHLRVATTVPESKESGVYALRSVGRDLVTVGHVGGLGRGERIFGVRFIGPTGYVVTFRQTDPLYLIDLRHPAEPRLTGELELTGYSAYLHQVAEGQVIGVGQEANRQGRREGTLISLFDVSDPTAPRRTGRYHRPASRSEVESDPHAFLYWPRTSTLVIPITPSSTVVTPLPEPATGPGEVLVPVKPKAVPAGRAGALVLTVAGGSITEQAVVEHPSPAADRTAGSTTIRRSLVIGDTLWTYSTAGLRANNLNTLADEAWLAF